VFGLNLRYPGQYFDAESGLHYNYFRDYEARTGRYVQSDPVGLVGGPNTYSYVEATPLVLIDSVGLTPARASLGRPNQGICTVVCDGKGNMVPQLNCAGRVSDKYKNCGLGKCLAEHEYSHIQDYVDIGHGRICAYGSAGVTVRASPRSFFNQTEQAAYATTIACVLNLLKETSECSPCWDFLQLNKDYFYDKFEQHGRGD